MTEATSIPPVRAACAYACVPLRLAGDLTSEMSSQVLFGETCTVLDRKGVLWHVRLDFDGYAGWVDSRQFVRISDNSSTAPLVVAAEICAPAVSPHRTVHLPMGAALPQWRDGKFHLGGEEFSYHGKTMTAGGPPDPGALLDHAMRYDQAPYLWGGRSPFGIDCSGLTQMTFRAFGVPLLRDCIQQVTQGIPVPFTDRRPGDLAFFRSSRDSSRHVGIVFPDSRILHASSCVRLDRLTTAGIAHAQTGEITHRLKEIRRVLQS